MAEIHELQVTPEERAECLARVRNLMHIYNKKLYTKGNIENIFMELESTVRRLKQGEILIEENSAAAQKSEVGEAHMKALGDLYYLLTRMVSLYEGFFTSAFPPEDEDRHRRVQARLQQIYAILS